MGFVIGLFVGWFMPLLVLFFTAVGLIVAMVIIASHFVYSIIKLFISIGKYSEDERKKIRRKTKEMLRKNLAYLR